MDCVFYDDRTNVVAMMDFAISEQFDLIFPPSHLYRSDVVHSLFLLLCLSCNDMYWLLRAWCLKYGQIAQLVEYLPNDPKIVGLNQNSAPNTFSLKTTKIIFLICFLEIYSRIDLGILQIQSHIIYSCNIYIFVCLYIARAVFSSVCRAWGLHSLGRGFESHLALTYPTL